MDRSRGRASLRAAPSNSSASEPSPSPGRARCAASSGSAGVLVRASAAGEAPVVLTPRRRALARLLARRAARCRPAASRPAPMPGGPGRPRRSAPPFFAAFMTRNVTKPATRRITSRIGITYSMPFALPLPPGGQTTPGGCVRCPGTDARRRRPRADATRLPPRAAVDPIGRRPDQGGTDDGRHARRQDDRLPRHRRRGAGGAHGALEGRAGRRRHARADLARGRRGAGVQPPRQGRHVPGRPHGRRRGRRRATTAWCSRAASPTPTSCAPTSDAVALRPRLLRGRQAGRGDLPRPVDADRRRRRRGPHADLVAVAADRPAQRGRDLGRRGGPRRRGPRDLAQPGRPAGVLRQARRGVRRGRARGPARRAPHA